MQKKNMCESKTSKIITEELVEKFFDINQILRKAINAEDYFTVERAAILLASNLEMLNEQFNIDLIACSK